MKETDLIQDKARRMSRDELVAEIERCEGGLRVAQSKGAAKRYQTRLGLLREELAQRKSP